MRCFWCFLLLLSAPVFCCLTGCASNFDSTPSTLSGVRVNGSLHGGQQPVEGAHIYLMAASTSGYGSNSVSLIHSGSADGTDGTGSYVLTLADGSFSVSNDYSCTSTQQVYLLGLYGNPGLSGTVNATQIAALTALGPCSGLGSLPSIQINEVSTIAMAYALAGFMSSPTQVATSSSAQGATNLANAFAMAANLESQGGALAVTPAGNGTVPQAEINTLANILAACVNQSSGAAMPCFKLFSNAKAGGATGSTPTNTAQAAINIAHNPGSVGVGNLFELQSGYSAFQPALTAAPADFSLFIAYTASGFTYPEVPSVDADGNVWVPSYNGPLVKLSPLGAQLSPNGGFTGGGTLSGLGSAVDGNGYVWVTNSGAIAKFSSSGNFIGNYSGGNGSDILGYQTLAIDPSNDILYTDQESFGVYNNSGAPLSPSTGYLGGYVTAGSVDSTGMIWITDKDGYVSSFTASGTQASQFADGDYGQSAPIALAIDKSNQIWVADSNTPEISRFTTAGAHTTYSGGGTQDPYSISIDGAGSAWVGNLSGVVSGFSNTGTVLTPSTGYAILPAGDNVVHTAADGSGNLWVTEGSQRSVLQFVGLTVPVVTPITPAKLGITP